MYWRISWLGLPTAGTRTPVSPLWSWTVAVTADEWSVISVTIETVGRDLGDLPHQRAVADHRVVDPDAVVGALIDLDGRVPQRRIAAEQMGGNRGVTADADRVVQADLAGQLDVLDLGALSGGELLAELLVLLDVAGRAGSWPGTCPRRSRRRRGTGLSAVLAPSWIGESTSTMPRCTLCSGLLVDSPKYAVSRIRETATSSPRTARRRRTCLSCMSTGHSEGTRPFGVGDFRATPSDGAAASGPSGRPAPKTFGGLAGHPRSA